MTGANVVRYAKKRRGFVGSRLDPRSREGGGRRLQQRRDDSSRERRENPRLVTGEAWRSRSARPLRRPSFPPAGSRSSLRQGRLLTAKERRLDVALKNKLTAISSPLLRWAR